MTNKKLDSETDDIFQLGTIENLRRSIKGYSILFTYTVLFTNMPLSTYMVQWHDSILLDQWCGIDWLCGVDWWCGSRMLLNQNSDGVLTNDLFQLNITCHVVQSWAFELFLSDGNYLSIVSINRKLALSNLTPLNLILGSIFYNYFSILYFLHILIKLSFYPNSIMSG